MATAQDRLAAKVARLEGLVRGLATGPQMGYSSLEDAGFEEYDGNGQLVSIVGKQPDGTHGAVVVSGPNPPRPSAPITSGGTGLLNFGWDGNFADEVTGATDITIPAPLDWARVEVHASPVAGFLAESADTLLDTLESPRGGSRTAMLEPGVWYVVLVSRALSGKRSGQSRQVMVEVLEPVGSDIDVDALREEFQAVDAEMNAAIIANKQAQDTLAGTVAGLQNTTLPGLSSDLALAKARLTSAETAISTAIPTQITTAKNAAITAAAADAKLQAEAAEARAATTAALDAKAKAEAAQAAALASAKIYADAQASGAGSAALEAAKTDATSKANAAKQAAIDAAAADATAKKEQAEANAAADAKSKADKALADAKADAAAQVQVVVNTIMGQTYYGTAVPSASVPGGTIKTGSTYRRKNASGQIIGEYEYSGGAWVARVMTADTRTAIDVGELTAGSAAILEVVAQKIAASTAAFQKADIGNLTVTGSSALNTLTAQRIAANVGQFLSVTTDQLTAGSASIGTAVVDKLFAEMFATRKLYANQVFIGEPGNLFPDPNFLDPDGWGLSAGYSILAGGGRNGNNALAVAASASQAGKYYGSTDRGKQFRVTGGSTYQASVWVKAAAAVPVNGVSMYGKWTNPSTAVGGGFAAPSNGGNKAALVANAWTELLYEFTVPGEATQAILGLYTQATANTLVVFSEPSVKEKVTPSLIVDGLMNGQRIVGASIETNAAPNVGMKFTDNGLVAHGVGTYYDPVGKVNVLYDTKASIDTRVPAGTSFPSDRVPGLWFDSIRQTAAGVAPPAVPAAITASNAHAQGVRLQSSQQIDALDYRTALTVDQNLVAITAQSNRASQSAVPADQTLLNVGPTGWLLQTKKGEAFDSFGNLGGKLNSNGSRVVVTVQEFTCTGSKSSADANGQLINTLSRVPGASTDSLANPLGSGSVQFIESGLYAVDFHTQLFSNAGLTLGQAATGRAFLEITDLAGATISRTTMGVGEDHATASVSGKLMTNADAFRFKLYVTTGVTYWFRARIRLVRLA